MSAFNYYNYYVDGSNTRIMSYYFVKETTYKTESIAKDFEFRINKLKEAKFDFIHIPNFKIERDGLHIKITSDFIKGHRALNVVRIYNDLISKDWTFTDPIPDNFIVCANTEKTYIVDLDSFTYVPNIDDRKLIWARRCANWWPIHPLKYYTFDLDGIKT